METNLNLKLRTRMGDDLEEHAFGDTQLDTYKSKRPSQATLAGASTAAIGALGASICAASTAPFTVDTAAASP